MFEQILIRFRGGPITSNKDEEDESEDNSSDTTTSPPASEGVVGRETLQLPFSRSMAFKLSPSPSIARSPSPSGSFSSSSSVSTTNRSDSSQVHPVQQHVITPDQSSSSINSASVASGRQTRASRADSARRSTRSARSSAFQSPSAEEEEIARGHKRKASEMTAALPVPGIEIAVETPPEKRVTRAEAKKIEDENKIVTRSGRRLHGADHEQHEDGGGSLTRSGSSKRKSPFLEPKGHLLKRPASRIRNSTRSPSLEDEGDDDDSDEYNELHDSPSFVGEAKHYHDGVLKAHTKAAKAVPDFIATSSKPTTQKKASKLLATPTNSSSSTIILHQKASATFNHNISLKKNPEQKAQSHHHQAENMEEQRKRKLHPLLRLGPDSLGFPWWHNDDWLKEERTAGKKRRLEYDTEIVIGSTDDEGEEGTASSSKPDEPRKLRSSAARKSRTEKPSPPSLPVPLSAPTGSQRPAKKMKIEKFDFPEITLGATPRRDPLLDSRYTSYHEIRRNQEKADHTKELIKEGKNFARYSKLLSDIEEAADDGWLDVLGLEKPESTSEVKRLTKKKDRLVDELRAAKRRYPIYRAEREKINKKEINPSYAALLERTKQAPLKLKGRYIDGRDIK